jgi:predicted XRE-type DNA-binding protein
MTNIIDLQLADVQAIRQAKAEVEKAEQTLEAARQMYKLTVRAATRSMTQKQLAQVLNVTHQRISQLVNNG